MSVPIPGDFENFSDFCSRPNPKYPKGKNGKFKCPCCLHFTLGGIACYDICPVCFWKDDGTTGEHGLSPNGGVTLEEGQQNFKILGASREHDLPHVRPPEPDEKEE